MDSEDLLKKSRSISSCKSIKKFDFSTLYTVIPRSKLKDRIRELVQLCFIKNNGQRRYKYLLLGRDRSYFVKKKTLWFRQTVLWNRYHQNALLADLFLYSYKADFMERLHKKNEKKLVRSFNFTFHYIQNVCDIRSLNKSRLCDFVDRIYLISL